MVAVISYHRAKRTLKKAERNWEHYQRSKAGTTSASSRPQSSAAPTFGGNGPLGRSTR